jgi:predicted HTH domain antitoxin
MVKQIELPKKVQNAISMAKEAREEAEKTNERAQAALRVAAFMLTQERDLSLRDAAELLGISHQRVQQLVETRAKTYQDRAARRHDGCDGRMLEADRRHGGTLQFNGGPVQNVDHVVGFCEECGAQGRWTEPR